MAKGSGRSSSARSEASAGLLSCFSGEKQEDQHGTLGQPPLTKACATLPACPPDQLETEPRRGAGVGALMSVPWSSGARKSSGLRGPKLSLASELGAAEGQGQGPGGKDI